MNASWRGWDVEPLAVALTSLETDTAAARSSGLVGSGDISTVNTS
jgi:hypothetical protein